MGHLWSLHAINEAVSSSRRSRASAFWGETLGDTVPASAILDRLLHHSHLLSVGGEDYLQREK